MTEKNNKKMDFEQARDQLKTKLIGMFGYAATGMIFKDGKKTIAVRLQLRPATAEELEELESYSKEIGYPIDVSYIGIPKVR